MPPACYGKSTLRRPALSLAQDPASPDPEPTPAPMLNDFFQEFMRTCIKRVRDQVPAALAAPAAEVRDNTNRPFKPRNPDLYYGYLQ